MAFNLKPSNYQPTKAELEEDLSVPVTLEELAKAALSGGVKVPDLKPGRSGLLVTEYYSI